MLIRHARRVPISAGCRLLIATCVVSCVGLLAAQVPPETPPPGVDLDSVGAGELLRRSAAGWVPLPVVDVDVDLQVNGLIVHGKVEQSFDNPTGEVVEALYVFPLPDRAAVHRMEMQVGDRRIVSVIREKAEARKVYERAKSAGRKAALLDQRRPNLFTTAAANINPGETVTVVLEYFEELEYVDGVFRLAFPLTYTPRFEPPQNAGAAPDAAPAPPFVHTDHPSAPRATIVARINTGTAVDDVVSVSHRIDVERKANRLIVRPEGRSVPADRDFRLAWRPRLGAAPQAALFVEQREQERFGLLLLWPPLPESETGQGMPTETLFVIDVSGSMEGSSIRQARQALIAALNRLRPEDRFNIVKFNDTHSAFAGEFRQAVPENLDAARSWVGGLQAGGGTMIYPALMRALALAGESRSAHSQRIIFLTDGAVGNEQEVLRAIHERLGDVRLHALGIGSAPNAYLMRKIAAEGHGICEFIADAGQAGNRIDDFFSRLERPVLTDLELEWTGLEVDDVYPRELPDLHAGQPLLISMRLAEGARGGSVRLVGHSRLGPLETTASLSNLEWGGRGIAARWARTKIGSIMDGLHAGVDPAVVRADVIDLALEHHLVTRYTSLVAVEQIPTAMGQPRTGPVASTLPRGGSSGPLMRRIGVLVCIAGLILLGWARLLHRVRVFRPEP